MALGPELRSSLPSLATVARLFISGLDLTPEIEPSAIIRAGTAPG